jgi:hypothetical protein
VMRPAASLLSSANVLKTEPEARLRSPLIFGERGSDYHSSSISR